MVAYLVGYVGESSSVEPVALGTGTANELVEESDGLLRRILVILVLNHARLGKQKTLAFTTDVIFIEPRQTIADYREKFNASPTAHHVLRVSTYHMSGADVGVVPEVLHERVIVRRKQRATRHLRQTRQHGARNRRAVIRRRTATCTQTHIHALLRDVMIAIRRIYKRLRPCYENCYIN